MRRGFMAACFALAAAETSAATLDVTVSASETIKVAACEHWVLPEPFGGHGVECDLTNIGDRVITEAQVSGSAHDQGRSLPWEEFKNRRIEIEGGIEAGETARVTVGFFKSMLRSNPEKLNIRLDIH